MEEKRIAMIEDFRSKLSVVLSENGYSDYVYEIVDNYRTFIDILINDGSIKNENDLDLYRVDSVKYFDGHAYASWCMHDLTLQKRFFVERDSEGRRNTLFHELTHSLMEKYFLHNQDMTNFNCFLLKIDSFLTEEQITDIRFKYTDIFFDKYFENNGNLAANVNQTLNEITTEYLSNILTLKSYGKTKREKRSFKSKIFVDNDYFVSDLTSYQEYEQVFFSFLRTINGFGKFESDLDLFNKWFEMLQKGTIWNQIVCTYQEKNNMELLFDFLISYNALRKAKESSMGIDVEYQGNKELLTHSIMELDKKLRINRNYDDEKIYDYVEFPPPPPIIIDTNKHSKR